MALRWDFRERIGEWVEVDNDGKENTYYLYQGNALLIALAEWEESGTSMYAMHMFFADKEHMKNMLGLSKEYHYGENILQDNGYGSVLKKIKLNKTKCKQLKDIVDAFVKAFDEIEIEIYSE